MSMKSTSAPRRTYTRNGVTHVCFDGRYFGPGASTDINTALPVTLEKLPSDGGRARCQVTQKSRNAPTVVETWRSVKVPRHPRS